MLDRYRASLAEQCRRYGIAELSVFGSVARGEDGPESDVDLLYVPGPTTRLSWKIVDFKDDLEETLGRRVDLVPKSGRKWVVRDRVLAEARVLYAA
jgi:predicted nucleotidyltransferase